MSKALGEGARAVDLRLDRQHLCLRRRLCGRGPGIERTCLIPKGAVALGKLSQSADAWRAASSR